MMEVKSEKIFETLKENIFNKQICVEKGYGDSELEEIVRLLEPSGTACNWSINLKLKRVECADDPNKEHVCFIC